MYPTRTMVLPALAALCVMACAVPIAPSSEGASDLHFQLSARDARGLAASLDGIVRRPEFWLSSARPLLPVELVLIAGEADAELLEDLASLPLRAAAERRVVPSFTLQEGPVLRLAPRVTLAKGASYTLALPGTARVHDGAALGDGGPAFIAQLKTSAETSAGAAWRSSLPAAGQREVPVNLATVFVALDGDLDAASNLDDAIWLEGPDGAAVPARVERVDCVSVEANAATCMQLAVNGELGPGAHYAVRSGRGLRDARGAPVQPLTAAFETASGPDRRPPGFERVGCLPDEVEATFGCLTRGDTWVELTLRSDESVRVAVRSDSSSPASSANPQVARPADPSQPQSQPMAAGEPPADASTPRDASDAADGSASPSDAGRDFPDPSDPESRGQAAAFALGPRTPGIGAQLAAAGDASLRSSGFAPDSAFSLTLTATDLAGNFSDVRVTGATLPPLATLSITEVLADPEGADTHQEYVEIWNFGHEPTELRGISLSDASGKPSVVAAEIELAPNGRALLVSDDFELPLQPSAASAASGSHEPDSRDIPAGIRLVRAGPSLTKSGIANAGEALYLRDAQGHRLSAAPAFATAAGRCLARVAAEPRAGALADFAESRCTPGR